MCYRRDDVLPPREPPDEPLYELPLDDELRDDEPTLRLPTEPTVVVPRDDDELR